MKEYRVGNRILLLLDYQYDSFAAAWAIQSSILSVATMEVLSNKVVLTYITKQAPYFRQTVRYSVQ